MTPTIADSGSWSLGVLIGGPFAVLFMLLGLAALVVGVLMQRDAGDGWPYIGGAIAYLLALGLFLASPLCYWPFSAEYHQWRDVSGTVQQIDKRLIGSGDGMEEKFVVRLEGTSQQFACDDTRCAQVRVGDSLSLSCKRAWQYTGTDGYDCRFISTEVTR